MLLLLIKNSFYEEYGDEINLVMDSKVRHGKMIFELLDKVVKICE